MFDPLETDPLRRQLEEERAIVDRVWKALGIESYEQAKPLAINEHVAALRAKLDESERKAFQLCYLSGSMMLACKQLKQLQEAHRDGWKHLSYCGAHNGMCDICRITLPDFSDEAINKLVEESNAAYAKLDEMRKALQMIADVSEASTTANSLPNIAKLARAALARHHGTQGEKR